MLDDAHARSPFVHGTDRARGEAAAAVRADVENLGLDAVGAEGAFVRADARIERARRQVLVTIFAVRPKLKRHGRLAVVCTMIANWPGDSKGEFPSICDSQFPVVPAEEPGSIT